MKRTLLALAFGLALAAGAKAQVTVDGDLTDIKAVAQADQADPINEILPNCKSGFDVAHVYVFYKFSTDQLYVGIDIMDVPPGSGPNYPGPGVPGDADGDNDPDGRSNPNCPEVVTDQPGVGPDEEYLVRIDTDLDGSFDHHNDLRIMYRNNHFDLQRGDGSAAPAGMSGSIKLGTRIAPHHPTAIPDENPNTDDIELVVNNYKLIDPIPNCFRLDTFSGSLVDIPPEDVLNTPITFVQIHPATTLVKTVQNVTKGGAFADVVNVAPGDTVRFKLVMANTGDIRLDPYIVRDTIPAGLTFVPGSVVGASVVQFASPVLTLKSLGGVTFLDPGQSRQVTFDCTVNVGAPASMINSATGGGNVPAGECGNLSAQATDTAQLVQVSIDCTKEVSLDGVNYSASVTAVPGQDVFFRVTVNNPSGVAFQKVTFQDVLPVGFSNVTSLDGRCSVSGNTVSCANIGPLAPGGSTQVTYKAKVAATSGTLTNTAHVEGFINSGDSQPAATHDCQARVVVNTPCLQCDKEVSLDGVSFSPSLAVDTDQTVTFRVTVTNCGNASLFSVSLTDTLPAGYANLVSLDGRCTASGLTLSCAQIGPLAPGASTQVKYSAKVVATNPPTTTLTNTATVSGTPGSAGNPGTPVGDTCSSTVNPRPCGLACEKLASKDGVTYNGSIMAQDGDTIFFKINVTNTAPAGGCTFATVSLSDPLPAGLTFSMFQNVPAGDSCNFDAGTKTVMCTINNLGPGQTHTVIFTVKVDAGASGIINNSVTVQGTSGSPGNPGRTYNDTCQAQIRLEQQRVPALSAWGLLLLACCLGAAMMRQARRRGALGAAA